jgi:hypothetical protein
MPPKLKVKPPKEDGGGPSPNDGGGAKESSTLPSSARGCVGAADVSFAETNGGGLKQPSAYMDSLSELELRICSIAKDHLETSFDLSRSTGYIAWKAKNEMK